MRFHRRFLWLNALAALAVAAFVWFAWRREPRLNVLLITLDTTRADRLGCYGYRPAQTPHLDDLARRGVVFERAYAPAPLTLPSHATLLTGLYPPEHGLRNNGQAALPETLPTLATELQRAGYDTAAFVAAFVLDRKFGLSRGFHVYDDDLSQADGDAEGHHRYREGRRVVDAALAWLRPRGNKPFFCWVHVFDPHFPYLAHEDRYGNQFAERPYDAELAYADDELGRLLAWLEQAGTRDRTIIVVVGDHGESLGEHGEQAHGMTLYDAALRVPLIIAAPGRHSPGRRVADPVSLADVCPTLLEILGREPLSNISGRSLRPELAEESLPSRALYAETDEPYHHARWSPPRALLSSQWKYIRSPQAELYDLTNDPRELTNLAHEQPDRVAQFEQELAAWEQQLEQRQARQVALNDQERRTLSSLGYAARRQAEAAGEEPLRDVKEMLPYYNLLNEANAMMDAGRYDLAEPVLRDILAAEDGYFLAHGDLGRCLLRTDRVAEAIGHLRQNVAADPTADRVRAMLGAALFLQGDYEDAAAELQTTIRSLPDWHEPRFNLGLTLEKLGRTQEAIEQYQLCLELLPHFLPARQRLEILSQSSSTR